MPKLDESWDKALSIPRLRIWRQKRKSKFSCHPRWKQKCPKGAAQSPWGSVTVSVPLETSQKKSLSVESCFWGTYTPPQHPSANQAPVPCSCALYPHRECHRPVELCPTFRNSRFPGTQQGRVSNADLAHRPCLGASWSCHRHSQNTAQLLGVCVHWDTEKHLLQPLITLDLPQCSPPDTAGIRQPEPGPCQQA